MKKVFHSPLGIMYCLFFLLGMMSCQVGRFVTYNVADIKDYKKFPSRPLHANEQAFHFDTTVKGILPEVTIKNKKVPFDHFLEDNKTVAFLVIKEDTIVYERYFKGYEKASIVPSFSMAKSITSILIGCAIADGLIGSVEDPVIKYIPALEANGFENITIQHLLQMTSGIRFNESYINPFGHAASFYYGRDLRRNCLRLKLEVEPGKEYKYQSGNTQLLGLVLEKALGEKTLTQYLQEKLWTPLGMEFNASWSIDQKKNGLEKTFCCINATAIDFAKIGRLYRNMGVWNGQQIISEDWVKESTTPAGTEGAATYYQYQWWMVSDAGDYMAQGILGQYIYIHPEKNLIIVRLGKNYGKASWRQIFMSLAAAIN